MVGVWFAPVVKFNNAATEDYNFGNASQNAEDSGNPRISGVRIYWSSNEDGHTALWKMFDLDFIKGINVLGADGGGAGNNSYAPWKEATAPSEKHATVDLGTV